MLRPARGYKLKGGRAENVPSLLTVSVVCPLPPPSFFFQRKSDHLACGMMNFSYAVLGKYQHFFLNAQFVATLYTIHIMPKVINIYTLELFVRHVCIMYMLKYLDVSEPIQVIQCHCVVLVRSFSSSA